MAKKNQKEETIVDVQEVYTKTEMFVDRHRKTLTYGIGALVLIFVVYFGYESLIVRPQNTEASESIWKAEQYLEMDSIDLAMYGDGLYLGLEDIAADYGNTKAGKRANYHLGLIYRDRAEYDTALDYLKKADFNDDVIGVLALGNIGDIYVEQGELEEGLKWYKKAASKGDGTASSMYTAPTYLFKAALVNMELENYSAARTDLQKISDKYPDFHDIDRAEKYLHSLAKK